MQNDTVCLHIDPESQDCFNVCKNVISLVENENTWGKQADYVLFQTCSYFTRKRVLDDFRVLLFYITI